MCHERLAPQCLSCEEHGRLITPDKLVTHVVQTFRDLEIPSGKISLVALSVVIDLLLQQLIELLIGHRKKFRTMTMGGHGHREMTRLEILAAISGQFCKRRGDIVPVLVVARFAQLPDPEDLLASAGHHAEFLNRRAHVEHHRVLADEVIVGHQQFKLTGVAVNDQEFPASRSEIGFRDRARRKHGVDQCHGHLRASRQSLESEYLGSGLSRIEHGQRSGPRSDDRFGQSRPTEKADLLDHPGTKIGGLEAVQGHEQNVIERLGRCAGETSKCRFSNRQQVPIAQHDVLEHLKVGGTWSRPIQAGHGIKMCRSRLVR